MALPDNAYYYNGQLRSFILQFMAIFAGLQVEVGKTSTRDEALISTPIHYGHMDRIVAAILGENTQNKPLRLPIMSAYMRGVDIAQDRMHGSAGERRNTYTPVGGLTPDDTKVIHQRMAIPYNMEMELGIYASNTNQHFQILEQIFLLFNPQLMIQKSDAVFDWTRLTSVELKSVGMDTNFPVGVDRRICQSTLTFQMPVWIDAPVDVRRDFVEKIYARIGAVSTAALTNYDIIAELDQQGIGYELLFSADDLTIQ